MTSPGTASARLGWFGIALLLAACHGAASDRSTTGAAPEAGCEISGVAAGLPADMPCSPGDLPLDGGRCQPAGVPPSGCGAGFIPDDRGGCRPVLPDGVCPPGLLAVPGDANCHDLGTCGTGDYGNIVTDATTQFVNAVYQGGSSDGSKAHPWTTIQAAIQAAPPGGLIAVAAGTYPGDVAIKGKPVQLAGRCAELVHIEGKGTFAAIAVGPGAAGSAIRDVTVTGPSVGVTVSGSTGVTMERILVHDTGARGVDVESALGWTSATLSASLVERTKDLGIGVVGAPLHIKGSVVRDVVASKPVATGRGINIQNDPNGVQADVTITGSLVERCAESGISVHGSIVDIDTTVVRDIAPNGDGNLGTGVDVRANGTSSLPLHVTVAASVITRATLAGVLAEGSELTLTHTTIADTAVGHADLDHYGAGVVVVAKQGSAHMPVVGIHETAITGSPDVALSLQGVKADVGSLLVTGTGVGAVTAQPVGVSILDTLWGARSDVDLRHCKIEHNRVAGIAIMGADVRIVSAVVRDTLPAADGEFGYGVVVQVDPDTGERGNLQKMHASLLEQNHGAGILVTDADADIDACVVRDTLASGARLSGRGIQIQNDLTMGAPPIASIHATSIERSVEAGLMISTAEDVTISETLICETRFNRDGNFGDGVSVVSGSGPTAAHINSSWLVGNAGAGVSAYGVVMDLRDTELICNGYDLRSQDWAGLTASFGSVRENGNTCGCPGAADDCSIKPGDLAPPPTDLQGTDPH
ncbi:MAG: right-handed parallel beta-helix repeat-containing protein [Minicystis sp.]